MDIGTANCSLIDTPMCNIKICQFFHSPPHVGLQHLGWKVAELHHLSEQETVPEIGLLTKMSVASERFDI